MNLHDEIVAMGQRAQVASRQLVQLNSRKKRSIIEAMADEVDARCGEIIEANKKDLENSHAAGLSEAMMDRLLLNEARIKGMTKALRAVATLKDPIGQKISKWIRPNGLEIVKQRVPIGVICVVYESRPNVTADTAGLCFKASSAVILRGGKEAINSNAAIARALVDGGMKKGMPENTIQLVETTDREAVKELVCLEGMVDLVMPRGGESLIRAVTEQALVPVIKHYKGVCHTYVDVNADLEMALNIVENAKCQRPGVCNAMETLLVHEGVAEVFLASLAERFSEIGVEMRGDAAAKNLVPEMKEAVEDDWAAEYLELVLAVRIVESVEQAVEHINKYGSKHSDAIVTADDQASKYFVLMVDSSSVYVNASTRFTDGGEFGMGAEIGISTDKLHARGPMGLEELTTYKYVIAGSGQIRE